MQTDDAMKQDEESDADSADIHPAEKVRMFYGIPRCEFGCEPDCQHLYWPFTMICGGCYEPREQIRPECEYCDREAVYGCECTWYAGHDLFWDRCECPADDDDDEDDEEDENDEDVDDVHRRGDDKPPQKKVKV